MAMKKDMQQNLESFQYNERTTRLLAMFNKLSDGGKNKLINVLTLLLDAENIEKES